MPISGSIGVEVQDRFQELLKQRLYEEQLAAAQQQREFQNQMQLRAEEARTAEAAERAEQRQYLRGEREREQAEAATGRRAKSNIAGLLQMGELGPDVIEREAVTSALHGGIEVPKAVGDLTAGQRQRTIIEGIRAKSPEAAALIEAGVAPSRELLMTPEQRAAEEERAIARAGKLADVQAAAAARHRAPTAPERESKQWVVRDGQEVYVVPQPGDQRAPSLSQAAQDPSRAGRFTAAKGFFERLKTLNETINTKMGPEAGLTGVARRGAAAIGLDPDVAEYERLRAAAGRAIAVAILGAQNLSDADAQVWADMLPDARTDRETAKRLLAQVENMLQQSSGGTAPLQPGTKVQIPPLGGGDVTTGTYVFDPKTGTIVPKK